MERLAVRRTIDLECSADALWRLVTSPDQLASWLGSDVELELRTGGSGRVVDDDGLARHLRVDELVDGRRLAFTWWPEDDERAASEVVFAIEATDSGSRLLVTETATGAAPALATTSWDVRIVSLWLAVCSQAVTV
jgi:uncharacterized protein YndB with AHSA1/START domain